MSTTKADLARKYFLEGANCAQATAGAFAEECGMPPETIFKLVSGFGGGVGRLREICGAASGIVFVLNTLYGNADISDKNAKDAHYARIQEVLKTLEKQTGSLVCRELLGMPSSASDSPRSAERSADYYRKRPCADIVALAAGTLENYLAAVN